MVRDVGKCALGDKCIAPTSELCNRHKCFICEKVIHVLCGVFHPEKDEYCCRIDCTPNVHRPVVESVRMDDDDNESNICKSVASDNNKSKSNTKFTAIKCPKCGGDDHQRSSSAKCKYYKKRKKKDTVVVDQSATKSSKTTNKKPAKAATTKEIVNEVTQNMLEEIENGSGVSKPNNNDGSINLATPNYIYVGKHETEDEANKRYKPVVNVASSNFKPTPSVYKIFTKNHRNQNVELVPSPESLILTYWSIDVMKKVTHNSNKYIAIKKINQPNLDYWKRVEGVKIELHEMYQFIAILYYMGIVKLPAKEDYWSTEPIMPRHEVCVTLGMTCRRFQFIWRNFHINDPSPDEDTLDDDEETECVTNSEEDAEDEFLEIQMERVQQEQDDNDITDTDPSTTTTAAPTNNNPSSKNDVWFRKLSLLVDNFRNVSESLIYILGSLLSIDEMIIRFMGRSLEIHRLKNKPISEGYNFFVLATSEGFIVNFTPDGRTAAKTGELEYDTDKGMGKIESMIMYVLRKIEILKQKQQKRIQTYYRKIKTRNNSEVNFDEEIQNTFIVAMDNYFTLPSVMSKLREMGIGCVGTSRFRRNWPSPALTKISQEQANFNDFFWMIDEHNTLVGRWLDNGLVFVVSTVHKIGNYITRTRKRPRKTPKNERHVDIVWGKNGSAKINIPTLIDDYNHWMGGVDLADQRIAYYHPNTRALRTWVPMFMQILSLVRNNSYLVYRTNNPKPMSHKKFTLELINVLLQEAHYHLRNQHEGDDHDGDVLINDCITESVSHGDVSEITMKTPSPNKPISRTTRSRSKSPVPSKSSARSTMVIQDSSIAASTVSKISPRNKTIRDFPARLIQPRSEHVRVSTKTHPSNNTSKKRIAKACLYCSLLFNAKKKGKGDGENMKWDKEVKRTEFFCLKCKYFLCKNHFDIFHSNI